MRIGICSDHAGLEYKTKLIAYLLGKGYEVVNYGTDSPDSCDYPDFAHRLGYALDNGDVDAGIALCGTGNGMAITLNKHQDVRAGLAWCPEVGALIRQHNDANVIVLPGRFIDNKTAEKILDTFFKTAFEGGRHQRRVEKIPVTAGE